MQNKKDWEDAHVARTRRVTGRVYYSPVSEPGKPTLALKHAVAELGVSVATGIR